MLQGYAVRSYLISPRNNGVRAIDAIHTALKDKPQLPTPQHPGTAAQPLNGHAGECPPPIRGRADRAEPLFSSPSAAESDETFQWKGNLFTGYHYHEVKAKPAEYIKWSE
jgi:hypothetical protein